MPKLAVRARVCVLVAGGALVITVAAPVGARPASPDATRRGPLEVETIDYDAQIELVRGPIYGYPERLRGRIHVPAGKTGPLPVILFVPGRHEACRVAGTDFSAGPVLVGPCPDAPPAIEDHPSWRGFDYLGTNLASHGYLVVTINTNAVNVLGPLNGTEERTQLIARTLTMLDEWNEGPRPIPDGVGDALVGKVDLGRIGLMGHSRGADAVGNFLREEVARGKERLFPGLRAVFELEGVAIPGQNDAPAGAHLGVLVGSCDADTGLSNVAAWERGRFVPEASKHSRVLFHVVGANHNFFNSEWYDEWDPPPTQPFPLNEYSGNASCSAAQSTNVRLAREDQERIGLALIAAFMRRYVGGEMQFQALMNGSEPLPRGACPTGRYGKGKPLPCGQILRASYLAPQRDRLVLLHPDHSSSLGDQVRDRGFEQLGTCTGARGCPQPTSASVADQLVASWRGPATLEIPLEKPVDAARFEAFTFRTMMNPSSDLNDGHPSQDFRIVLTDGAGRSASVRAGRYCCALLRPLVDDGTLYEAADPEGDGYRSLHLNGLRIPLSDFRGIDLTHVASIELRFGAETRSGSIQLAELALQRDAPSKPDLSKRRSRGIM